MKALGVACLAAMLALGLAGGTLCVAADEDEPEAPPAEEQTADDSTADAAES